MSRLVGLPGLVAIALFVVGCADATVLPTGGITGNPDPDSPAPSATGAGVVGRWDLAEMGPTADFAHIVPTIEFTADGRVSGFAACNTFSGSYTTAGSTLTLGPLATTKMACQRPASAVEAGYLLALSGVSGWSIEPDGRLALEGTVPLRFVRR